MKPIVKRLIILLVLVLAGCRPVTYQAVPTKTPQTPTVRPASTEMQLTETMVLTSTVSSLILQEDLKITWQPALSGGLILYAVCPMMADTASRRQAELINDETAFGELFAEGLLLSGVKAAFTDWKPEDPQVTMYKEGLQNQLEALLAVVKYWSNQAVETPQVIEDLNILCPQVQAHLGEMVTSVQQAGMTQETLDQILMEFQDDMSEIKTTE